VVSLCAAILEALDQPECTLSIVFVSAPEMRKLNRQFRRRDVTTDVLSFAYPGATVDGLPFLGEVVISPEVAARQALQYGSSEEREIRRLIAHGILHLLGYDHQADGGLMSLVQRRLLRRKFCVSLPPILSSKVGR